MTIAPVKWTVDELKTALTGRAQGREARPITLADPQSQNPILRSLPRSTTVTSIIILIQKTFFC